MREKRRENRVLGSQDEKQHTAICIDPLHSDGLSLFIVNPDSGLGRGPVVGHAQYIGGDASCAGCKSKGSV